MVTVADILHFVETLAPTSMKMEWDHVGLNCGRPENTVGKVLVALDPFDEAIEEAKEFGAQLLLTHHVLIYDPGFITSQDTQGRRILTLIENGIAHINAHTNLDCAPGGVNDCLAESLGLSDIQIPFPMGTDENGAPYGLIRTGTVTPQPLKTFLETVKFRLGSPGLRYVSTGKDVHRVAVGGGSCGDFLLDAYNAGCDTFVTADIKYNVFRDAFDLGMNLIDAGHFHTENPVCHYLAQRLQSRFPELEIKVSEKHTDPMKFFI